MSLMTNKAALRGVFSLALAALFVTVGCQSSDHSDPDAVMREGIEHVLFATPADSSVACYRIPALDEVGGVLIAAIDERVPSCQDLRANRDSNILIRRSFDKGSTWEVAQRVMDYEDGVAASDPSFIVDRSNQRIHMLVNVMDHDDAPGQYRFHLISSDDFGATWSAPVDITDQVTPSEWANDFMFVTSGHGVQAEDGTLLHTIVNLQRGVHVLMSGDYGASWKLAPSPVVPGDESKIITLEDGSWMVNSRVAGAGHRWVHRSLDRGASWISEPDSALVDPAVNASLVRHPEGLIFVNAHHPDERANLTIRVQKDGAWQEVMTLEEGSAAYASAAILEDGSLGVFYERKGYTENVFQRIPSAIVNRWFDQP